MFLHFSGLSLLVHLIIIGVASIVNFSRGEKYGSAFQTYKRNDGKVQNGLTNRVISVSILVVVMGYMLMLFTFAITTGLKVGASEPQVIFAKGLFVLGVSGLAMLLVNPLVQIIIVTLTSIISAVFVYLNRAPIISRFNLLIKSNNIKIDLQKILAFPRFASLKSGRLFTISGLSTSIVPLCIGLVLGISFFSLPLWAGAQIVEPGFESEVVADGFTLATTLDFTPDGRILVAEKSGTIRVIKNGVLLPEPLITLTDVNTFGDRGLLGLAVDPNFAVNGYIYVSYTYENTPGLNVAGSKTGRIVRLTVIGDVADESSKMILVGSVGGEALTPSCEDYVVTADCIASDSNSHSVGGLRFGPDGKLYATLGDGSDFSAVDPRALRAQNVDALAGKMLRINADGTAPADNPFYNGDPTANRSKVYALGLRNAFRFNFNPVTGQLYAGDVGWSNWEEVNRVVPGANFGWPCREGNGATSYGCTASSATTDPLYTYPHNASGAGSITGGAFASNNAYPDAYDTSFFIGDYAQMWMKRLVLNAAGTAVVSVEDFIPQDVWPVEITTGPDGNVYYLDIVFGSLNRLTHTEGNRSPVVSISGTPTSGLIPLTVSFSSAGTMDPDSDALTYMWDFDDGSTSNSQNPAHTYTTNGSYLVSLKVTDTNGAEVTKILNILVGNQAPTANITSPSSGSLYTELQTLTVSGEATDPETGVLPPSSYVWNVVLHHNIHTHTLQTISGTSTISFPADDHNDSDVYIEVILNVTDPAGLTDTKSINLYYNNGIGSGNLVSNASLEVAGVVGNSPLDWYQGWYGVMNPVFTYPVTGLAGSNAAKIDVLSHTSGSAKWYFTPAFVTPGAQYTFSDLYTATVGTVLFAQYSRTDGTFQYAYLGSLPATATPARTNITFIIPAGIESVTVFHEIAAVGQLVVDDYSLALAGSDIVLPTGNITAPLNNATVSSIVPVTVNAADNDGVASVQLLVNGALTGVPDSEAPYTIQWDTTGVVDGSYSLTARIFDLSGNEFVTAPVEVTVDNNNTTPINLIVNGDFETENGANPLGWQPAGWGTHSSTFSYPVAGATGGKAAQVTITDYVYGDTGDAKWGHTPVPVTSGTEYTFETMYKATSISDVIGRYTMSDGSVHYFGLIKEVPPIATWTKLTKSFVPPVGAQSIVFYHLISSEATLTVDDVGLYATGTGTPSETNPPLIDFLSPTPGTTLSGTVTVTAAASDDTAVVGVYFALNGALFGAEDFTAPYQATLNTTNYPNGTYVLKATTHDPFGNNDKKEITITINNSATSTPPTPPTGTSTNLVTNGTLEIAGTAGNPANWNRGGWGTNTRTYTYPATGFTGNGATVAISGYSNGDAKWYFDPVVITPGTEYTVSDRYNSTVASEVLARFTKTDGTFAYQFLQTLPSTAGAWQTFTNTITPAAGNTHLTLFHVIAGNGSLTVDDVSILGPASTPTSTPDTTAPTVSVTSPTSGATLSGTVAVTANASDTSGITSVTLLVDGLEVGFADTTAPYSFNLDTTTLVDGAHTIGAQAVDTIGNIGTASIVNVTVSNGTTTPPVTGNLIFNSDLETVGTDGNPANWKRGGWGTNNRVYTYPAAGQAGNGAQISMTSYTSGDAKWFFDEVPVTPGAQYTFSYSYLSTATTNITIRYTKTDGTTTYVGVANPAASPTWQTASFSFVPPADVVSATVMHILNQAGSLTIDNQSLTTGNTNNFNRGKLTFSFDDGWLEHYTTALPILDAAGIDGTFYIVTDEMQNANQPERVDNPTLETVGTNGDPANWNRGGWGTNDRTLVYPVAGKTGNGAEISVTTYTNGDAKWYFDPVIVTPDAQYTVGDNYKSTVASQLLARYTMVDGSYSYVLISSLPSTGGAWAHTEKNITIPSEATYITLFHLIAGVGSLVIDDASVKPQHFYANQSQVEALYNSGHEIGVHTRTHTSLTTLDLAGKQNEIAGARQALIDAGFGPVTSIAYPYGDFDNVVQQVAQAAGLSLGRSVLRGYNDTTTDPYALKIQQIGRTHTLAEVQGWIDQAAASDTWLILMFHQINDDLNSNLGITESDFSALVDYANNADVDHITVAQGAALLP